MSLFEEKDFNHRRYVVLLASKPVGKQAHGRVWRSARDDAFMVDTDGHMLTVTTIAQWLTAKNLMMAGPARAHGGFYLVPTSTGLDKLDEKLRGAQNES